MEREGPLPRGGARRLTQFDGEAVDDDYGCGGSGDMLG
jgi:hypothetical protein